MRERGCSPLSLTVTCSGAPVADKLVLSIAQAIGASATSFALAGCASLGPALAPRLAAALPRLQDLTLDVGSAAAARGAEALLEQLAIRCPDPATLDGPSPSDNPPCGPGPGPPPPHHHTTPPDAPTPAPPPLPRPPTPTTSLPPPISVPLPPPPPLLSLQLRLSGHAALPGVALEGLRGLRALALGLELAPGAGLGQLRTRGSEAPPAVAAIASLAPTLRRLELTGSSLSDRILDPPYRFAGLSDLTGLTYLRVDLPCDFPAVLDNVEELYRVATSGSAGVGLDGAVQAVAHAVPWLVPSECCTTECCTAFLRWHWLPAAASLDCLVELHLGRSYDLSVYDMAMVLHRAVHLTVLSCRTLSLPPYPAAAAPGGGMADGWQPGSGGRWAADPCGGGGGGGAAALARLFPPALRELRVRYLPPAPLLAALSALQRPPPLAPPELICRQAAKAAEAAQLELAAAWRAVRPPPPAAAAVAYGSGTPPETADGAPGPQSDGVEMAERAPEAEAGVLEPGGSSLGGTAAGATDDAEGVAEAAAVSRAAAEAARRCVRGSGAVRLALAGSSCAAASVPAEPWLPDVAAAAFRLLRSHLAPAQPQAHAGPGPAHAGPRGTFAASGTSASGAPAGLDAEPDLPVGPAVTEAEAARSALLLQVFKAAEQPRRLLESPPPALFKPAPDWCPALSVRAFQSGACRLTGPHAGSWLRNLALLGGEWAELQPPSPLESTPGPAAPIGPAAALSPGSGAASASPLPGADQAPGTTPPHLGPEPPGPPGSAVERPDLQAPQQPRQQVSAQPQGPALAWRPGLRALQLRGFDLGLGALLELPGALPGLRFLELRNCTAPDADVLALWHWLRRQPGVDGRAAPPLVSEPHTALLAWAEHASGPAAAPAGAGPALAAAEAMAAGANIVAALAAGIEEGVVLGWDEVEPGDGEWGEVEPGGSGDEGG
ncbi:hypothetical protein HYH03_010623 [Edaphochlamys debaryana]|uniref:Uncharacterized protein n=1 Tax=Edaphochlamys debaryana TaxID=47281 RepID=A0A836BVR6_9CHLO|nr:hypothetical protein HYH03_010623 [Edaphochlamys debaryana]|eukprot:KAG2490946.1 hypothetical protein HYH03_010623 [Edaphochlamys debaryana]